MGLNKHDIWQPTEFTYDLGIMGYVKKGQQPDLTVMLEIDPVLILKTKDRDAYRYTCITKMLENTRESYFTTTCGHSF